jgi:SAM-dependent methyltransferase
MAPADGPDGPAGGSVEETWRVGAREGMTVAEYLLYRRHLFAYEEAARRCPSAATVVDLDCGLGDGLEGLDPSKATVVAVDLAFTPLASLRHPLIRRVQADASRLPIRTASTDLAVGFQLIEHVSEDVTLQIVSEVRRILRKGGRGFLTTPNARWRLRPGERPWNPFHVIEYWPKDLERLCSRAGVPASAVQGVIGINGAHEVEVERVRPRSRLEQRSPRVVGAALRSVRLATGHTLARSSRSIAGPDLQGRTWFALTSNYEDSLDFWIEIEA